MHDNDDFFINIRKEIESKSFPPNLAKLYSQYTKTVSNQPSLKGWRGEDEFNNRLEDAIFLIDAGFYEKESGRPVWKEMFKRSGEILEWLSHPNLNKFNKPLNLLSAACYQIAGYPALAFGLINSNKYNRLDSSSNILRQLLKSNFKDLQHEINDYWEQREDRETSQTNSNSEFNQWVIDEIVRCLGIICAFMRWNDSTRIDKAQQKLIYLSKLMLDGKDPYSWLLAKLISEVTQEYLNSSLSKQIGGIYSNSTLNGKEAYDRYLKSNFLSGKSLAWPSQIQGIEKLNSDESFALCTPTGSGKTTIAELAIIQSLFNTNHLKKDSLSIFLENNVHPIVLYLVPSRALATEVESKLSRVLSNISDIDIKVTGLYGGTDWGPTDAWITTDDPTVLICTYEKGEALIRFLGPLFLNRLSLVVIDEAHSVQFDGKYSTLVTADNRSLRLESLASRLITELEDGKVIALSAVAEQGIVALSNWITGKEDAEPEINEYKSTRQLIGRLYWDRKGDYEIQYDLLNSSSLKFNAEKKERNLPYIQDPFESFPIEYDKIPKKFTNKGAGKRQRPYLFWAILQKVKPNNLGEKRSVLVSITQHIDGYADDFVYFFEKLLRKHKIVPPTIFTYPTDIDDQKLWNRCLLACEDYFGVNSNEYKLLQRGIVVHHGNMPGVLSRLLVEVIEKKIVSLALATSTLSEGVNLPFESVIIPTVTRESDSISLSEFKNLIGRAGRPGSGTEGESLVVLQDGLSDWSAKNAKDQYEKLITLLDLQHKTENRKKLKIKSPLSELLNHIYEKWQEVSGTNNMSEFENWLETTIPDFGKEAEESLDSLDGILLSSIVEFESKSTISNLNREEIEKHLKKVWSNTYSFYVEQNSSWFEDAFTKRGGVLFEKTYPDVEFRQKLYNTSISPRYAKELLASYNKIIELFIDGKDYYLWSNEEKIYYIRRIISEITSLKKFEIKISLGKESNKRSWQEILYWWFDSSNAPHQPKKTDIAKWIKFIKKNFEYIFNWGLGSVISLKSAEVFGILHKSSLKDWEKTGLPWIIFWIKELIVWGTLDPVAAHLLSHGLANTRFEAENIAENYYILKTDSKEDVYNASEIRKWIISLKESKEFKKRSENEIKVIVNEKYKNRGEWRVLPIKREEQIIWLDPAGFEMGASNISNEWDKEYLFQKDFILNTNRNIVIKKDFI